MPDLRRRNFVVQGGKVPAGIAGNDTSLANVFPAQLGEVVVSGSADGKSRWLMMPATYRPMTCVVARQARIAIGMLAAMLTLTGLVTPQADAADVDAAIVFAVDVSASINRGTADLQREGHAAALCSPEIIAAIARNRIGCIGIFYFEWSSRGHWNKVLPWTTVCGSGEAQAAAAIIRENGDRGDGFGGRRGTSISYAIEMGSLLLGEFQGNATNKIIDISANGRNNDGLPVEQSRLRAIAKGYTINAIAIPSFMRGIEHDNFRYFAENVIGGPGAFVVVPATTNDYAAAIRRKLVDEISLPMKGSNDPIPLIKLVDVTLLR